MTFWNCTTSSSTNTYHTPFIMLTRGNTDAATRLRRAKSTSSVVRDHHSNPISPAEPQISRRNAVVAAARAYERSHDFTQAEPADLLRRQQSHRDIGKVRQSQGKHLAQQRTKPSKLRKSESSHIISNTLMQQLKNNEAPLPPVTTPHPWPVTSDNTRQALSTPRTWDRSSVFTADCNSMPTPTISVSRTPIIIPTRGLSRLQTEAGTASSNRSPQSRLRDYTRSDPIPGYENTFSDNHDQYEEILTVLSRKNNSQTEQQPVPRKHRSFISIPFMSRRGRDSTSHDSTADHSSVNDQQDSQAASTQGRGLPSTLRKTISRAFHRSPSIATVLPAQHVIAQRDHFTRSPDYEPLKSAPSSTFPIGHSGGGRRDSTMTGHGFSRVTSWANSSGHDSTAVEEETNQISNAEDHILPQMTSSHDFAATSKLQGIRKRSSRFNVREIVDSHRVFSALVKRIESKKESVLGIGKEDCIENGQPYGSNASPTVKLIPLDVHGEKYDAIITETGKDRPMQLSARYDAMSPSIYSSHSANYVCSVESVYAEPDVGGTALVTASQPVKR